MLFQINNLTIWEECAWPCNFTELKYEQYRWTWISNLHVIPAQLQMRRFHGRMKARSMEPSALDGVFDALLRSRNRQFHFVVLKSIQNRAIET